MLAQWGKGTLGKDYPSTLSVFLWRRAVCKESGRKSYKNCVFLTGYSYSRARKIVFLSEFFCGKVQVRSKQSFNILLRGVQCIVTYFFDIK